jgi:hypothetical protein
MRLAPILQPLTEPLLSPLVTAITGASGGGFSPISLFTASEKGYIYDNNDLTSFYLDSAGTTPATVNGLVGLQLDKSKATPVARRNRLTYSEQFDNAAWSELAAGGGTAPVVTANAGTAPDGTTTADKVVFVAPVSGDISILSQAPAVSAGTYAGSLYVKADGAGDVGKIIAFRHVAAGASLLVTLTSSWQRIEKTEVYEVSNFEIILRPSIGTSSGTVSVQLWGAQLEIAASASEYQRVVQTEGGWLLGNHRYQTTTGSKPILRGTPVGGNIVTNGDFASETGWTTGSFWAISGGTATKSAGSVGSLTSAFSDNVAGKVYRVEIDITSITAGSGSLTVRFTGGTSVIGTPYTTAGKKVEYITGNGTNSGISIICNASDTLAVVESIDVRDVSASAVTAPYGLQYDGVDDFLQTASVDFTATDKMAVVMGVRKLSDASQGVIVELSASAISNNGSFAIVAPSSGTAPNYVYASKGTTSVVSAVSALSFAAPITNVVSGISDIAADNCVVRCNGADSGLTATDQGTGNYGNYALFFGRRGGSSSPYNGLDFGGVCVGKTLTATQLANIERWVNQRTGAY